MRMKTNLCTFLIAAALTIATPALAEEPQGTIDWVNGFIVATGQGTANPKEQKTVARLKALRAAEVSAQRALLEVIKGVRIDAQTTVKNMLLEEDVINTRVEGFLRGAMVTKKNVEIVDGVPLATVEMKVCMTGAAGECASKPSLVGVLEIDRRKEPPFVPAERFVLIVPPGTKRPIPPAATEQPPAPTQPPAAPPEPPPAAMEPPPAPPVPQPEASAPPVVQPVQAPTPPPPGRAPMYDSSRPVTGIILSLDGRYFEREVLPVVITAGPDNAYKTVYSVKCVNPSVVRTYGAVRYADNVESARQIQTIGVNPLILPVENVTKENMLVVRAQDASIIRETISHGNNYLSDAKVVISIR